MMLVSLQSDLSVVGALGAEAVLLLIHAYHSDRSCQPIEGGSPTGLQSRNRRRGKATTE
jgi:hypothetical protein